MFPNWSCTENFSFIQKIGRNCNQRCAYGETYDVPYIGKEKTKHCKNEESTNTCFFLGKNYRIFYWNKRYYMFPPEKKFSDAKCKSFCMLLFGLKYSIN